MTGRNAYKIWVNAAGVWADWVRPVPFISPDTNMLRSGTALTVPTVAYIKETSAESAVMLDVPSSEGVTEGIALARIGFSPVPLYNGCKAQAGTMSLVDNRDIEQALIFGAEELTRLEFASNAPPVFLLDSNRICRFKMSVSVFDNSWDIYPQDMPSAMYFLTHGIKKIIVRGQKINKDLKPILYAYQRSGIKIYYTNGYEQAKNIVLRKILKRII